MKLKVSFRQLAKVALLALAAPSTAFAVLGGDVSSLQTDRMSMKATLPVARKSANYTVHEMTTASGVTVREYAAPTGIVFAVAWQGRTAPDLQQLLGSYFETYSAAANIKHAGHSHLAVRQDKLVVMSRGHMRAFSGVAYLPDMLPSDLKEADIK